jgi:hypothetical protein
MRTKRNEVGQTPPAKRDAASEASATRSIVRSYAADVPQSKSKRSRYTPPPQKKAPPSKLWVPVALTTLLAAGLLVVVGNYLNMLPGVNTENRYLLLGIGLICSGFLLATNYR